MPLSEDEQRILHEIERQFYEHDPEFARGVSSTTLYSHASRNLKWAFLGFIAGLILMLASFATNLLLGFAGFVMMLGCAVVFERNLRKRGTAGWKSVTASMPEGGLKGYAESLRKRLRRPFKKDDG